MNLPFVKMQGCGNSYLFFDCQNVAPDDKMMRQTAMAVSDAAFGVGSDGAVFLLKDESCFCRMRIFNKDGSEGTVCGNALRCVGKLFYAKLPFAVRTGAGVRWLAQNRGEVNVDMGPAQIATDRHFAVGKRLLQACEVNVGNRHLVVFDGDDDAFFKLFRYSRVKDINFMWARRLKDGSFAVLPVERGSGVTLSCGSGACAVAAAAVYFGFADAQKEVRVRSEGGILSVGMKGDHMHQTGPVQMCCKGSWKIL